MIALFLLASATANSPAADIVITASRLPAPAEETSASVTEIDAERIERLGQPLVPALLRLAPSVAVSAGGSAGTIAQVRIRGAEANQTLLFVDGIKANDHTFGDEPRFELLNADLASRIEVVRGPQSALWGSQAIGGVVAVDGTQSSARGMNGLVEGGSFGSLRAAGSAALASDSVYATAAIGWQRANGIDIFGGGDRDGYRNISGRALVRWDVSPSLQLGANGFAISGRSEFDGDDPFTFLNSHALDTDSRLRAGRIWARVGEARDRGDGWNAKASASILGAKNRNRFEGSEFNRASGERTNLSAQASYGFTLGKWHHDLIVALDHERESFKVRDSLYGGATDQDSVRRHSALTGEWRAKGGPLVTDIAIRRDRFSKFADATTLRASILGNLGGGFALAASYGEGINPPTFTELFGFFPGSFIGNPALKPEKSRGFEGSLRFAGSNVEAAITVYRQRLSEEIAPVFFPDFTSSVVNLSEKSTRWGLEMEAGWTIADRLRLSTTYAYLRAIEPDGTGGNRAELRRPRHSGSLAVDGVVGRIIYGGSISYTGRRPDQDYEVFPARDVALHSYWLADARIAYRLSRELDLFVRGSNLLGQRYQDVFGYRTEGRGLYAGIRLAGRRSSR